MSTFHHASQDPVRVQRGLVTFLLFVLTIVAATFALRSGSPMLMAGLVALPFAFMLMSRPQDAFVLALLLDATLLPIPGVSYTTLGMIAKILLIGVFVLGLIMRRLPWQGEPQAEKKPLLCFAGIILMLMAVRGSGLRMLGSATWGGMMYIVLLISILFFLTVNGLRISKKQIHWVVWGSLLAGLVGAILQHRGWGSVEEAGGVTASRLMWLSPVVGALFPLAFALKFKRMPWISFLLLLCCLALMGLTGFRSRLVGLVMVASGYGFFKARSKVHYIVVLGVFGLLSWGAIIVLSSHLPLGLQRAISFVPGTHIDVRTAGDAAHSISWRLEIWGYCLGQAKQFWLIGRGSAFNVWETAGNLGVGDIQTGSPWFAFQTRSYHSGPLSLLIDYGVPGLLVAFWLTGLVFKRMWRLATRLARLDTFESRYALFLCVSILWQWVAFYLVFGAMTGFAKLIVSTAATLVISGSVFILMKSKREMEPGVSVACAELSK